MAGDQTITLDGKNLFKAPPPEICEAVFQRLYVADPKNEGRPRKMDWTICGKYGRVKTVTGEFVGQYHQEHTLLPL